MQLRKLTKPLQNNNLFESWQTKQLAEVNNNF